MGEFVVVLIVLSVIIIPLLIVSNHQEKLKASEVVSYAINKYSADDFFTTMFFESKLREEYRVEKDFYKRKLTNKEEYENAAKKIESQRETLRNYLGINEKQMDNYYTNYAVYKRAFRENL